MGFMIGNRRIAITAAALLCLTGLAGCNQHTTTTSATQTSSAPAAGTTTAPSQTPSATETTPSLTPSESAAPPSQASVPADWKTYTAPKSKVGFAIPSAWATITSADLAGASKATALDEVAKRLKSTPQAVENIVKPADFFGVGDDANFVVVAMPSMPSETMIKRLEATYQAKDFVVTRTPTPIGEGITATYSVSKPTGTIYQHNTFVPTPAGAVNVVLTSPTPTKATEYAKQILSSLTLA